MTPIIPISFFVRGEPKGQPRPRAFAFQGRARIYNPASAEGWKSQVAEAARAHVPAKPIEDPLSLRLRFFFPRPKNHYRSGKHAGELKPGASLWMVHKPDLDNLAKAVMDALKVLGFFGDDAQIVVLEVSKEYAEADIGTPTGCLLMLRSLNTESKDDEPAAHLHGVLRV